MPPRHLAPVVRATTIRVCRDLNGIHKPPRPTVIMLAYPSKSPYAVGFQFGVWPGMTWEVSRDLLYLGCLNDAGEGDIFIEPVEDDLHIKFENYNGSFLFTIPKAAVHAFLQEANDLIRVGEEGEHLDLDACIASLLA